MCNNYANIVICCNERKRSTEEMFKGRQRMMCVVFCLFVGGFWVPSYSWNILSRGLKRKIISKNCADFAIQLCAPHNHCLYLVYFMLIYLLRCHRYVKCDHKKSLNLHMAYSNCYFVAHFLCLNGLVNVSINKIKGSTANRTMVDYACAYAR